MRLVWAEGGIGCHAQGTTVPFCRAEMRRSWKAVTRVYFEPDGHLGGATIDVHPRRTFTQAQKDNIACHEVGHALGLGHSRHRSSCLTQGSSSPGPDAQAVSSLRASYAHPR